MPTPFPPYGWHRRHEQTHTLIWGWEFTPAWPLLVFAVSGPIVLVLLPFAWNALVLLGMTSTVALAALGLGFRLQVGPAGFTYSRTWMGMAIRTVQLPLTAEVGLAGAPTGPPDRVAIVRPESNEEVVLGSPKSCEALYFSVLEAKIRWSLHA